AVAEHLTRQHLVAPYDRFAAAEIDHHVAVFHPFDDAVDDVADAVLVFFILPVALGFELLLHIHLLGRLRGGAVVYDRRQQGGVGGPIGAGGWGRGGVSRRIWNGGFSTASTTSMFRDRCSSPLFGSISARTSVSLP